MRRAGGRLSHGNLAPVERVIRVVAGVVLYGLGIVVLIRGVGPHPLEVLDVAFVAFAVDLVFTGVTGFCPLYYVLGWDLPHPPDRRRRN